MKRVLLALVLGYSAVSVSALDLSVTALFNYDLVRENGVPVLDRKKLSDLAYLGFGVEVPFSERGGLVVQNAVKFEDTGVVGIGYNKNIHWDSTLKYAWHAFGREHFVDPYLTLGAGCSGAVFFDDRADQWQTKTQLVLFPEVGAGITLRFEDWFVGTNARTQVLAFNPSPLKTYEQLPVALAFSVGLTL